MIRADAGFCNSEFINACFAKGFGFICAYKKQSNFYDHIRKVKNWQPSSLKSRDGRDLELGSCSISFAQSAKPVRMIIARAKSDDRQASLFSMDQYDYFGFLTNMGAHEIPNEKAILFYRKRGQAENFIKEQKYGQDLKHYPCSKLSANKAFGLIAGFAHSLMRAMALLNPRVKRTKKGRISIPQYAKAQRRKWLQIPVEIARHAGSVVFRYCERHFLEVQGWLRRLEKLQLGRAFTT